VILVCCSAEFDYPIMKTIRALLLAGAITTGPLVASGQAPRIRDSSGVRIVENPSRLKAPTAFRLGDRPSFDVGGLEAEPANEFSTRQGYFRGIRLSNGTVAVLDGRRIQIFDRTGQRLKISGREGKGPGEFMNITSLCSMRGDTIVVADGMLRRVTMMDKAGAFITSALFGEHGHAENQFCFDDGTILVGRVLPGDIKAPRTLRLSRLELGGSVSPIADVEYPAFDMLVPTTMEMAAWAQRVYVGSGLSHDIKVFAADGTLTSIIRTDDALRPITSDERAKLQPMGYRAGSTEAERKAAAAQAVAQSKTVHWPTFERMFVDVSGRLWVEDWRLYDPVAASAWTAFDADGRLLGRLTIPAAASKDKAIRVVQFGRDEVFIRRFDDDGALHLTAYPLISVRSR
jgi:hypothetical protein